MSALHEQAIQSKLNKIYFNHTFLLAIDFGTFLFSSLYVLVTLKDKIMYIALISKVNIIHFSCSLS